MESYQSIVLAECVMRERRERAERNVEIHNALSGEGSKGSPRETVAGALIALARWMAPQHAALRVQTR